MPDLSPDFIGTPTFCHENTGTPPAQQPAGVTYLQGHLWVKFKLGNQFRPRLKLLCFRINVKVKDCALRRKLDCLEFCHPPLAELHSVVHELQDKKRRKQANLEKFITDGECYLSQSTRVGLVLKNIFHSITILSFFLLLSLIFHFLHFSSSLLFIPLNNSSSVLITPRMSEIRQMDQFEKEKSVPMTKQTLD